MMTQLKCRVRSLFVLAAPDSSSFTLVPDRKDAQQVPRQDGIVDASDLEAAPGSYPPQRQQTTSSETAADASFAPVRGEDEEPDELEGGLDDHAFHHPALYRQQPTVCVPCRTYSSGTERSHQIWLPKDALGLSDEAVKNARAHDIDITNKDATIDSKGKIHISRDSIPGTDQDS